MALQSIGCVNGGGQLKPEEGSQVGAREALAVAEQAYASPPTATPDTSGALVALYRDLGISPGDATARQLFRTQYHAIEKSQVSGLAVQW